MKQLLRLLLLATLAPACGKDSTGPAARSVQVAVLAGDVQFALPGAPLAEPLQVIVTDAVSERPVKDVEVTWRVVQGNATLLAATSKTDGHGVATTTLRLGEQVGSYSVEASATGQVGQSPRFQAFAVQAPSLAAVAPASAAAGDTVVLTGQNFHPQPDLNTVLFGGIRGQVVSASPTQVRAVVPSCVPSRTVSVQLWIGAVSSETRSLAATGVAGTPLALQPGDVRAFADPGDLACVRLPGGVTGARYVLIPQNVAPSYAAAMPFVLAAYTGVAPVATPLPAAARLTTADRFEYQLRRREAGWVEAAAELRRATSPLRASLADPQPGDRRTFNVLKPDNTSESITAEVKAVSARAILYQDLAAPAGGFAPADFTRLGQVFDDPIYGTNTSVFGNPSDIDGNGRIIILFTPRVNALTPRGDNAAIAGYFYGCDLVPRTRCSVTNSGEIFYSLVPDPQAAFGDARTTTTVLRTVLPVIAHEFQHMISFASRDETLDALWLSEGLAHTAEDLVGAVFQQRGDATTARDFSRSNYIRAGRFLDELSSTSMIAEDDPGTLELRGGAWLLLRYLRAHYGGNQLLARLTQTRLSSTANVAQQTGQSWSRLLGDFAVALYAEGASELGGVALAPRYTFGDLSVRQSMLLEGVGYPLEVTSLLVDQALSGQLPSSASRIFVLNTPASTTYPPINLVLGGTRGGAFISAGTPQLMLLRTR